MTDCMYEAPREKTEWEDALVKHKILKASERKITQDERDLKRLNYEDSLDKTDIRLGNKSLEQLDELEDSEDEETLQIYRAKRLAELRKKQGAAKYGSLEQIIEAEYKKEVTEASAKGTGVFVVLHLFAYSKTECRLMNSALEVLAKKFPAVKFRKIVGGECIRGYPESRCPTLIIYHNGEILKQEVGLATFGGLKTSAETLEWVLGQWGVVKSKMEENPFKEISRMNIKAIAKKKGYRAASTSKNKDDDDDSDSDFFA